MLIPLGKPCSETASTTAPVSRVYDPFIHSCLQVYGTGTSFIEGDTLDELVGFSTNRLSINENAEIFGWTWLL